MINNGRVGAHPVGASQAAPRVTPSASPMAPVAPSSDPAGKAAFMDAVRAMQPGQATASVSLDPRQAALTGIQRRDHRQPVIDQLMTAAAAKKLSPAHLQVLNGIVASGTSSERLAIIAESLTHLGKPYRWGATGPSRFDCSGYSRHVLRETLGVEIPRVSNNQSRAGMAVKRSEMQPGDLVFFGSKSKVTHVGIYLGTDAQGRQLMINAAGGGPRGNGPNAKVRIEPIWSNFVGARRYVDDQGHKATVPKALHANWQEYYKRVENWLSDALVSRRG